ncbi:hypothetical protein AAULR_10555, partial [Lacticaseibacillus rhamnosus MTCC 5462]
SGIKTFYVTTTNCFEDVVAVNALYRPADGEH